MTMQTTPNDEQPPLTLLSAPLPSEEAIAKHVAASLQSCIEVLDMDWSVEACGDRYPSHPNP